MCSRYSAPRYSALNARAIYSTTAASVAADLLVDRFAFRGREIWAPAEPFLVPLWALKINRHLL